jgi:hypothetical protein
MSDPGLTSAGYDTLPSSPIIQAKIDQEEFDPGTLKPRTCDKIFTLDNLRALFPHLTDEELQRHNPACESCTDESYSNAEDPNQTDSHHDH